MATRVANRTRRPESELRLDAATVRYDLDMLVVAAIRYGDFHVKADSVGKNMAVESFAIHCRALIDFLYGHDDWNPQSGEKVKPARRDDVLAWDYCPGWEGY